MKQSAACENPKVAMKATIYGLILVLAGCGGKSVEAPKKAQAPRLPKITHFYGNEAMVPKGGSITLCYGTEDVETLRLTPSADGELRPSLNRCVAENVAADTTYTLTAKGPGGETSATFTVKVGKAAAVARKERVMIQNFQRLGDRPVAAGAPVQLCYSTEGAAEVSLRPSGKGETGPGKNVCVVVTPEKTTTYVLTAKAEDGAVDRMQVTVPVQ